VEGMTVISACTIPRLCMRRTRQGRIQEIDSDKPYINLETALTHLIHAMVISA
jgi:hypothetical protein